MNLNLSLTLLDVKLVSFLSDLDICVPRGTEQVGDASPAHCSGHGLAGRLNTGEQLGEVT